MIASFATCGASGNAPVMVNTSTVTGSQATLNCSLNYTRESKGTMPTEGLFDAQASYFTTSTGAFIRQDAKQTGSFQFVSNTVGVGESIRWTFWFRQRITNTPQWEFNAPLVPRV
jgi:hypothetical protein